MIKGQLLYRMGSYFVLINLDQKDLTKYFFEIFNFRARPVETILNH